MTESAQIAVIARAAGAIVRTEQQKGKGNVVRRIPAFISITCGLILDSVRRGRWEAKRLFYLSQSQAAHSDCRDRAGDGGYYRLPPPEMPSTGLVLDKIVRMYKSSRRAIYISAVRGLVSNICLFVVARVAFSHPCSSVVA